MAKFFLSLILMGFIFFSASVVPLAAEELNLNVADIDSKRTGSGAEMSSGSAPQQSPETPTDNEENIIPDGIKADTGDISGENNNNSALTVVDQANVKNDSKEERYKKIEARLNALEKINMAIFFFLAILLLVVVYFFIKLRRNY